ncbi:MAG: c-type cytochrome [Candidatus Methylomirabilales bacterium]
MWGKRACVVCMIAGSILAAAGTPEVLAAPARENFQRYCAQCHGPAGKGDGVNADVTKALGAAPKDLTNSVDLGRLSDDRIANIIAKGGSGNELSPLMPPWGNTLSRKEIQDLVRFIRDLCKCTYKP